MSRPWCYDLDAAPQEEHVEASYLDSDGRPCVAIVQAPLWEWHNVYAWRALDPPAPLPPPS